MSDEDWEDLDVRAESMICMCLAKNILANVLGISMAKCLWKKFRELYRVKEDQSSKNEEGDWEQDVAEYTEWSQIAYQKEQFHMLHMKKYENFGSPKCLERYHFLKWRLLELKLMINIRHRD